MTQTRKKLVFSWVLILAMVISVISPGSAFVVKAAEPYDGYVYVTVERFTLGQGLAAEPKKIGYYKSESMADILERGFGDQLIMTDGSWGAYISGFKDGGEPKEWSKTNIPQIIINALADNNITISDSVEERRSDKSVLSAGDYTGGYNSGWYTYIDNKEAMVGVSSLIYNENESASNYSNNSVYRLQYYIDSLNDLKVAKSSYNSPLREESSYPDMDDLIRQITDYIGAKTETVYTSAVEVLEDWDATEEEVVSATQKLKEANDKIVSDRAKLSYNYSKILSDATSKTKDKLSSPKYGDEWKVLYLNKSGLCNAQWNYNYINDVEKTVVAKGNNVLNNQSYATENARVIIGLNAAGGNPENVGGYNLLEPLANYDLIAKQGVNGLAYTLIALDTRKYDVPTLKSAGATQTTRELLIQGILDKQYAEGGWAYSGPQADPDMTGMVIQALAPYYNSNNKVKDAIDQALGVLSNIQDQDGGYSSWGCQGSYSCAQVLFALAALGIDAEKDTRFVKSNASVLDALLSYYIDTEKAFKGSPTDKSSVSAATDQSLYALTAYSMMKNGKTSLYDLSSVHQHKIILKNAKDATCTEKGYSGDKVCADCGEEFEKGVEIAAKGHTPVEIPEVAPTETTAGKTAGKKCSVCGEILEAPKDVPATGVKETLSTDYKVTSTDATTSSVEYTAADDQAETSVTIQNVVKDSSGKEYTVTKVADGAFANNKKLTDVTIGANVTTIGADAFKNCTKLSEVIIQDDSVTTVGAGAFSGAKALTEIDFSECKLQTIDKNAFSGCKKLKDIKLNGNKLTKVGKNAFKNVKKNAKFTIYAKNKKTYKKVVKLIKKSGAKKVKFTYKKKK